VKHDGRISILQSDNGYGNHFCDPSFRVKRIAHFSF
jgi:hypothetical protein